MIGFIKCRVDTTPQIVQCKTALSMNTPKIIALEFQTRSIKFGLLRARFHSTDHQAGSNLYPTMKSFMKKFLLARETDDAMEDSANSHHDYGTPN